METRTSNVRRIKQKVRGKKGAMEGKKKKKKKEEGDRDRVREDDRGKCTNRSRNIDDLMIFWLID